MPENEPNEDKLFLERYQNDRKLHRQDLIKQIEKITQRRLIVYTAKFGHPAAAINRDDIPIIEDLLHTISSSGAKGIDLMIHSSGGELGSTERILYMIRKRFRNFRVIVPNTAKSAATILALGSDRILMGPTSELGPIDPQIIKVLPNGNTVLIPAYSLINTLEGIREKVEKDAAASQIYLPILSNVEPEMIDICEKTIAESKEIAETWLKRYMLKRHPKKAKAIIDDLGSTKRFKTHGKLISGEEVKKMGLNVMILNDKQPLWKLMWELYYRSELLIRDDPATVKLFETNDSSINIRAIQIQPK